MALFVIGDLHLALSVSNKKMDIFGGWENYMELLEKNWNENISSEDTVVLAGDSSWAMNIRDAYEDFCWIEKMPGKKNSIITGAWALGRISYLLFDAANTQEKKLGLSNR